jgi:large subunit ribosomal protein L23
MSLTTFNTASVILRPRITEKSGVLSQTGVYTFEVTKGANKNSVALAVKALYKVTPVKVAMLNNPARNVFIRGRRGVVPGVRKAMVTLKKGDKIDFV